MTSSQPANEWKLEQGMTDPGLRDQTLHQSQSERKPAAPLELSIPDTRYDTAAFGRIDPDLEFREERPEWGGYVEWERYPEKKARAKAVLAACTFPPPPEFQLGALPDTNPVLEGVRWKMWHRAVGGRLARMPEESWATVQAEKHADMLHLLEFPYNGEAPKARVTGAAVTPNALHFVRNHGGIPSIGAAEFRLQLDGLVRRPRTFSLAELGAFFPRREALVTVQCSGTRRVEQINEYAGEGDEMINAPWAEGAIGTAKWTGVSLKKVIKYCGGLVDGAKHLELYGADSYVKHGELMNYVVSVPYSKVKSDEVLLAWEMNDEPLPKIHGFPLRAIVMGYIGARSCKWLYRIKGLEQPSRAPVQSKEYLYFNQQVGKHNQAYTRGIQIQEMPVSSAIMEPWNKEVLVHDGLVTLKGWAYSGGGRWPERVEVSVDGGFHWYEVAEANLSAKRKFAWRTWRVDVPLDAEGWTELTARCWDNALNTQPTLVRSAWNWGLHVTSSCHRVKVYSVNRAKAATRQRLREFADAGLPFAPITRPTTFGTQSDEEYERYWATHAPRDVED